MRPPADAPRAADYGRAFLRWWPAVLCAVVLSAAAAAAVTSVKAPKFAASAQVFAVVTGDAGVPAAYQGGRGAVARMSTYQALARSELVAERSINDLGSNEQPKSLTAKTTASLAPGSALMTITVTDLDGRAAVDEVNAIAKNLVEASSELEWTDGGPSANLVLIDDAQSSTPVTPRMTSQLFTGAVVGALLSIFTLLVFETSRGRLTTARQVRLAAGDAKHRRECVPIRTGAST